VIKKHKKLGIERLAEEKIIDKLKRFDSNPRVEFLSDSRIKVYVSKDSIPGIIGRNGSTIKELEGILSLHIDVVEIESSQSDEAKLDSDFGIPFDFSESRTSLLLDVGKKYSGHYADIYVNQEFLFSSRIGRKGQIKILKRSNDGKKLIRFTDSKNSIEIILKNR